MEHTGTLPTSLAVYVSISLRAAWPAIIQHVYPATLHPSSSMLAVNLAILSQMDAKAAIRQLAHHALLHICSIVHTAFNAIRVGRIAFNAILIIALIAHRLMLWRVKSVVHVWSVGRDGKCVSNVLKEDVRCVGSYTDLIVEEVVRLTVL
jgi:hypothetical protein